MLKDSHQQNNRLQRSEAPSGKKIGINSTTGPDSATSSPNKKFQELQDSAEKRRVIKTTYNLKAGRKRCSSGTEYDDDRQKATDTLHVNYSNNEDLGLL